MFTSRLVLNSTSILYDDEDISVANLVINRCSVERKHTSIPAIDNNNINIVITDSNETYEPSDSQMNGESMESRGTSIDVMVIPSQQLNREVNITTQDNDGQGSGTVNDNDGQVSILPTKVTYNDGSVITSLIYPSTPFATNSRTGDSLSTFDIESQTRSVLQNLQALLSSLSSSTKDVVFVHLYIQDMRHFEAINKIYCAAFDEKWPHPRCGVQVHAAAASVVVYVYMFFLFFIISCVFLAISCALCIVAEYYALQCV